MTKRIEKDVLKFIKNEHNTMFKIVNKFFSENKNILESTIRYTVWRLVDRGEIIFTKNRTFEITK